MRADVNAFDCTRGCADTVKESVWQVDSGRNIPCCPGKSNLSAACWSDALPTELHPHQTDRRVSFSFLGIPEGGSCDSNKTQTTRSVKQCVAGAACVNSTCKCLAGVSTKTGVLCGRQL